MAACTSQAHLLAERAEAVRPAYPPQPSKMPLQQPAQPAVLQRPRRTHRFVPALHGPRRQSEQPRRRERQTQGGWQRSGKADRPSPQRTPDAAHTGTSNGQQTAPVVDLNLPGWPSYSTSTGRDDRRAGADRPSARCLLLHLLLGPFGGYGLRTRASQVTRHRTCERWAARPTAGRAGHP